MNESKAYNLSVRAKDYTPENNTLFQLDKIKKTDLLNIVKNKNYSLITWKDNTRNAANFQYAVGGTVDIDNGLTIEKATERLKKKKLNHFIVTSKSHTKESNRFHILVFFNYPIHSSTTYEKAINDLTKIFPEADLACNDSARFIFGSPDDCETYEYWNGEDYDVTGYGGLWDQGTELLDKNKEKVELSETMDKTPIFCPFHIDESPSAFINFSGDNYFIYCSSCNETFWMYENKDQYYARKCKDFYSYGTDVYEFSMIKDSFAFNKIGKSKFHSFTGSSSSSELMKESWDYLLSQKHIKQICNIDYISDMESIESYYESDLSSGIFTVHHRALPANINDNNLIENYLDDRFGDYKDFIKKWLSVYCYTNYKKLPTLIFSGERGTGKSSFAEIISEIFPSLSYKWAGVETSFSYEVEKKFLIVEENQGDKLSQYKTLKNYSGSKDIEVKKKFKDPYLVKNNMNICILSNEAIPVFVRSEEMPSNSKNNQFFVYEFPVFSDEIDPQIQDKIIERLGHYVRTELKTVFENLSLDGYRYSIDVPITAYEKSLFENNITENEQEVAEFVSDLQDMIKHPTLGHSSYNEFLKIGEIPVKLLKEFKDYNTHSLTKAMIRMKYIHGKSEKVQVGGFRYHCYKMKGKLFDMIITEEE